MPLVEDFAPYFTDFSTAATIGASTVNGIFDADHSEVLGVTGSRPVFLCVAADLPTIVLGTTQAVIDGTTYTIAEQRPDGHGLINLILETT